MWEVSKIFRFEGAHSLPHLPEGHKCRNIHGHSYQVEVICSGDLIPDKSWVIDYADISKATLPIIERLDHQNINDVINITSTAENLAFWIFMKLMKEIPCLKEVRVYETPTTCCAYRPR